MRRRPGDGLLTSKSTHHFELNHDGSAIDVRADDASAATRDLIRSDFQHTALIFADGNFTAPLLVHSRNVPGTESMTRLKDRLHWNLSETPRGARFEVAADNREALAAVPEFLTSRP